MRGSRIVRSLFVLSLSVAGCDGVGVSESSRNVVTGNGDSLNGDSLNGDSLNGDSLNGDSLNGDSLNGDSLNGDSLNGDSLNGMTLSGSQLSATTASGSVLTGDALVGTTFDGITVGGKTVRLRIDSFSHGTGALWDVYYYGLSWHDGGTWRPLCANGDLSIPTSGRWNYGQGVPGGGSKTADPNFVTWACRTTSAIGKCIELGYKPWASVRGISLDPYHQACTRVIRADFCGDGTAYTVEGNLINLYDGLGVQLDTENWDMEAEWTAAGARCIVQTERSPVSVPCAASKYSPSCGARGHFNNGTLLMSETP